MTGQLQKVHRGHCSVTSKSLDCSSRRRCGGSREGERDAQTPPAAESGLFCDGWCGAVSFGLGEDGNALRAWEREVPPLLMSLRTPPVRGGGRLGKGSRNERQRRFLR
jgi:hypothetical protein